MKKTRVCECCGHPIPALEIMLDLTHLQGKLFLTVQRAGRAGIDADSIREVLYSEKGFPDSHSTLSVMKHQMGPKLQKHGLKITLRRGPGALWRLEAI